MILKIKESGRIICKDLKEAKSFKDRFLGLLDPRNPRNLLFRTRFGIHTFFLKEPIDVLILDQNLKIVHLRENVKPNNLVFWNPLLSYVVELKRGTIGKYHLSQTQALDIC